jgi:hypothetical protein
MKDGAPRARRRHAVAEGFDARAHQKILASTVATAR